MAAFQIITVLLFLFPVLTAAVGISFGVLAETAGRLALLLTAFRGYSLAISSITERRMWLRYTLLWAPPLLFVLITPRTAPGINPVLLAGRVYSDIPAAGLLPYGLFLLTAPASAAAALLIMGRRGKRRE